MFETKLQDVQAISLGSNLIPGCIIDSAAIYSTRIFDGTCWYVLIVCFCLHQLEGVGMFDISFR